MTNSVEVQQNEKMNVKKQIIHYAILAGVFILITILTPKENFGILTVIPAMFLLFYIFYTKRILESLTLGAVLGFLMAHKFAFLGPFNDMLIETMGDGDTVWLFIVCGLMGSIIALIEQAGGAWAFGEWVAKRAKTEKSTLLWSWILGCVIFIDDYLNSLTVGSCMAPITDKHKVPREFLAYIVDSTAAPVCVLIPISTWAVFIAGLSEQTGLVADGEGLKMFIKAIPFNFYGWFAALIVPLVIIGVIPIFGPMKQAYKRAKEEGILAPPGSEKIDIRGGEIIESPKNAKIMNFFLPIIFLIVSTIYFDIDLQYGVITTIVFMFVLYIPQGLMDPEEFADACIKGLKNMLFPLFMVVLAYAFAAGCDQIGFMEFVINTATKHLTPQWVPFVIFFVLGITEFIMGLSWGMYVIAIPIVLPLAQALGVDYWVVIGAVCSAGVWGSHICFYSDATILTSSATGCDNFRHAITQAPFGVLGAILSALAFLITGFILY